MEQMSFLPRETTEIVYESKPGHRKGWTIHTVTIYDENQEPIVFLESMTRGRRGVRYEMVRTAREAWMLRKERPFGDEYDTELCHVSYLYTLKD